ncbi:nucleotide sugar dehydrogenase [Helicobacter saguini]|uniref:UDP-glucose 6-dehydrogenase n=1 Tax=Helicobacter saguini TaxID=1548018 RepID=A0A347VSI7_9HELI|nr:nucleotide sugar dehydrogenase [Helicobacter saguini]MWV62489.1 nucleotide sugar dehydrogenase [Helicobacter saguini]MWV66838.1 nucleotide sugar dehydrogenase [Helicobacter saguini]MWV69188.1 nucleotide sugar dehydrogenase [Helicobacter saguini]MWV71257.1 nucleotide sugar dehydrogenase [Helicobacter saguini]TLD94224.1 nucleotide sugar dehydrogenase [Helicobacter saguini]
MTPLKNIESSLNIAVFGLGFVGLTTAVGLANAGVNQGFKVVGYEIDSKKALNLQNVKIPFYEKDLESALKKALKNNLIITDSITLALKNAEIIIFCIGTPMSSDGSANLSYILDALKSCIENIKITAKKPIFMIKSTIPPSSSSEVFIPFIESFNLKNGADFILANNPEFLREGFAYSDFMQPDRIVIGLDSIESKSKLKKLYSPFNAPLHFVSLNTAEFIKYLSNTTLSLNISYANEMSIIAQSIGNIDIIKAFKILHDDKRFCIESKKAGITSYLYPGLGFGGYCLPKDTLALYKKAKDKGYNAGILENILKVNDDILRFYVDKIKSECDLDSKIGILGLSFKPSSDDVRDSKSASLIKALLDSGFKNILAYDPLANEIFKATYDYKIKYAKSLESIMENSEVLVIATAWSEFKSILDSKKRIYNLRYMS